MKTWAAAIACLVGVSLTSGRALAEEGAQAVETGAPSRKDTSGLSSWQAPGECILLSDLRRKVEAQSAAAQKELRTVEGLVHPHDSGWQVTLTVFEAEIRLGQRLLDLPGEDCRAHDETLALVIALLLEHGPPMREEAIQESEPSNEPPPPATAPPEELPQESGAETPLAETQDRFGGRVGVGMRILGGLAPSLAWGPTILAGVTFLDTWAMDLQGDFYTRHTDQLLPSGQVVTSGGRLHARACAAPEVRRVRVSACPGVGWILLQASGRDLFEPQKVAFRTAEVGAEVGILGKILGPIGFLLEGGLFVPFRQGRFALDSADGLVEVHETAPAFASGSVSLLLDL
jgi:hypothetical protein